MRMCYSCIIQLIGSGCLWNERLRVNKPLIYTIVTRARQTIRKPAVQFDFLSVFARSAGAPLDWKRRAISCKASKDSERRVISCLASKDSERRVISCLASKDSERHVISCLASKDNATVQTPTMYCR